MLGSAALPFLFARRQVAGEYYRDGMLGRDNTPIRAPADLDRSDIVVVAQLAPGETVRQIEHPGLTLLRVRPSRPLTPEGTLGTPSGLLDFSPATFERLRARGYEDTERLLAGPPACWARRTRCGRPRSSRRTRCSGSSTRAAGCAAAREARGHGGPAAGAAVVPGSRGRAVTGRWTPSVTCAGRSGRRGRGGRRSPPIRRRARVNTAGNGQCPRARGPATLAVAVAQGEEPTWQAAVAAAVVLTGVLVAFPALLAGRRDQTGSGPGADDVRAPR
ncbi:hypothetical protein ABZZ36_09380 [Actinacidiphila glaucinigra]|uniref:hypothetical protein n=1 Tax=Actinacidiphila glaucinigra TaxID=235986 RepID=UPI0033A5DF84